MEGFIFGPETKLVHELSALLRKCGAAMVSGGIQLDMLYLKIKHNEIDFILGDNTIMSHDRLNTLCCFFKYADQPALFIYDADLSLRENAEGFLRQYKEYYNCNLPHRLNAIMPALSAILHGEGPRTQAEQNYTYSDGGICEAEHEDMIQPSSPPHRFTMNMAPAARSLYQFLFMHRNQNVTLEQMSYYLWNNAAKSHTRTLYCYIHTIRKCLNDAGGQHTLLIRVRPAVYRLNIPPEQEETYKCFE